jgi:hypothetical protein
VEEWHREHTLRRVPLSNAMDRKCWRDARTLCHAARDRAVPILQCLVVKRERVKEPECQEFLDSRAQCLAEADSLCPAAEISGTAMTKEEEAEFKKLAPHQQERRAPKRRLRSQHETKHQTLRRQFECLLRPAHKAKLSETCKTSDFYEVVSHKVMPQQHN